MQVDDRAPVPPTDEELRVERTTDEILASFEAALGARLPFADDRRRVPELAKEARPAVASCTSRSASRSKATKRLSSTTRASR
ncbi:MAG: hypothetical protein R3B99_34555 [Polyangiales bacterium]